MYHFSPKCQPPLNNHCNSLYRICSFILVAFHVSHLHQKYHLGILTRAGAFTVRLRMKCSPVFDLAWGHCSPFHFPVSDAPSCWSTVPSAVATRAPLPNLEEPSHPHPAPPSTHVTCSACFVAPVSGCCFLVHLLTDALPHFSYGKKQKFIKSGVDWHQVHRIRFYSQGSLGNARCRVFMNLTLQK